MNDGNNKILSSILEVLISIILGVMVGLALSKPIIYQYKQVQQNIEMQDRMNNERYEEYEHIFEGQKNK